MARWCCNGVGGGNWRKFPMKIVSVVIDVDHNSATMTEDNVYVSLTNESIQPIKLMDMVRSPEAGAIVLFAGTTRNNFEGI